jgi:RNA polymerase sigma-70 factor (ECF subfamily)
MAAYYARSCGEDADDLLQEAWIGLLEAIPEVDLGIGSPEQYLIQCARWRLLDAIKRARVRRCASLEDTPVEPVAHPSAMPAVDTVYVSEFAGQLSQTQQAVLDCLLQGLTWREAGNTLGCTSANIAYHVRQIRRQYVEWADEAASQVQF